MGEALCQFLECVDSARLPLHGGHATTVIVTIPLQALRDHSRGAPPETLVPWRSTHLADRILLCGHHHHRAHDAGYRTDRLPNLSGWAGCGVASIDRSKSRRCLAPARLEDKSEGLPAKGEGGQRRVCAISLLG